MRWIGNRSSGKTGIAIARALALRGAEVTLVHADITGTIPYYLKEVISTRTVIEMREAVLDRFGEMDWTIMCAAVADFTPDRTSSSKIKKSAGLDLKLVATPELLS